jgi:hypothetical protein
MTDTTTITVHAQAVIGRRIEFAYYSSRHSPEPTVWHPGIITELNPGLNGTVLAHLRLDGTRRSALHIPVDSEGLRYLDEVTTVPALPMGRFAPTAAELKAETYEGVPVFELEDGDLVILTDDRDRAGRVLAAYAKAHAWVIDGLGPDRLKAQWVVFEWAPEDAEYDWHMNDADQGDEHAVHTYYLPA